MDISADESSVTDSLGRRTGPRRQYTLEEKRRIVEETHVKGASVSTVARRYEVNPNQVFAWRQLYRQGLLNPQSARDSTEMLPVRVSTPTVLPTKPTAPVSKEARLERAGKQGKSLHRAPRTAISTNSGASANLQAVSISRIDPYSSSCDRKLTATRSRQDRQRAQAVEKLQWYAMRWKIETFFKILKSGCKAEQSKLRTAERLVNLLAAFCILSWRIFWLTIANRTMPAAPPKLAFTGLEIRLLDTLIRNRGPPPMSTSRTLSSYLISMAQLGGYLARASDPPPGNTVIWRGMSRLTDIEIGFTLGAQFVGN